MNNENGRPNLNKGDDGTGGNPQNQPPHPGNNPANPFVPPGHQAPFNPYGPPAASSGGGAAASAPPPVGPMSSGSTPLGGSAPGAGGPAAAGSAGPGGAWGAQPPAPREATAGQPTWYGAGIPGQPAFPQFPAGPGQSGFGPGPLGPGSPHQGPPQQGGIGAGPVSPYGSAPQAPGGMGANPYGAQPYHHAGSTAVGDNSGTRKGLIIGGILLTALLLLVGSVFGIKLLTKGNGGKDSASGGAAIPTEAPRGKEEAQPILDYFAMLKRGDAEGVKKLVEASTGTVDNAQLLTPEIIRKAAERITDVKVDEDGPSYEGMTKAVPKVSYTVGDKHYVESFIVAKKGDKWEISRLDLPELSVDTQRTSLMVNGQQVQIDPSSYSTRSLSVTPGVYDFAAPKSKYLGGSSAAATVGTGLAAIGTNVKLTETVTPAFTRDATTAINAYVASCARTPDRVVDCPLYAAAGTTWQITRRPTYSFTEGMEAGEFRVSTTTAGSAKYRKDYGSGYIYTGVRGYNPTGNIIVNGDQLKYEP